MESVTIEPKLIHTDDIKMMYGSTERFIERVRNKGDVLQRDNLRCGNYVQRLLRKHQLSQCCDCLMIGGREDFGTMGEREWRSYCNECDNEKARKYYQNNPEKYREIYRKYRQNNPEKYRESQRISGRKSYQNNPETYFFYRQSPNGIAVNKRNQYKRRALKMSNHAPYTTFQLNQRMGLFGNYCAYCGCDLPLSDKTIDHIIPLSKGGLDAIHNLIGVCKACNSSKNDNDFYRWMAQRFETMQFTKTTIITELSEPNITHDKAIKIMKMYQLPYIIDDEIKKFMRQFG